MMIFLERIAVEVVVTLCVGAVVGLMSGRWSIVDEAVGRNRRQACQRCSAAATTEASPNQGKAGSGHRR